MNNIQPLAVIISLIPGFLVAGVLIGVLVQFGKYCLDLMDRYYGIAGVAGFLVGVLAPLYLGSLGIGYIVGSLVYAALTGA